MQNVLILLAEDRGSTTDSVELIALDSISDLHGKVGDGVSISINDVVHGERSFQMALLPAEARDALTALQTQSSPALARNKFNIGYVSGNNQFFHPGPETIHDYRIPSDSLLASVQTSRQLSSQGLRPSSFDTSSSLWVPSDTLSEGEKEYVRFGQESGVDLGYKCRIRKPWYKVPGVKTPDTFLTTFSDRPRLHLNDAGWVASNSVLCGYLHNGESAHSFVSSWYTPLTLLSVELEIHSLGGGVMIAVPKEADSVRILNPNSTRPCDFTMLDEALTSSDTKEAYLVGSSSISDLVGTDGLAALVNGTDTLMRWRKAMI
jgi:hypothetical protein